MPFGVSNILVAFMNLVNRFIKSCLDQFVVVFIDPLASIDPTQIDDHVLNIHLS